MECHDLVRPFCLFLAEMSGGIHQTERGWFCMDADGKSPRTLLIIGQELALWRKSHGYKTQEDFAHLVGISHRKVQRLERGERLPAWEDIYRLKEFMGVEFEFFVTSEMERDKPHSGSKPMETRLNHLIRRLRMWYENSPYCEEKEDDMDTLEHLMGTIDRARKNYK